MARIFMALEVPPEVEEDLTEAVDAVRSARPDLRWVPSQRWHVTLEFLGECGPYEVDRQRERWVRRAARSRPMSLRVAGAGTFPDKAWMASVLWAGIADGARDLGRLAAYGQQPHLTLARTRGRTDLTGVVDELARYAGPSWTATEAVLMESHVRRGGERGPRYEVLDTFPLGDPVG